MKQCPSCQGLELYDDDSLYCPYCNTLLVPYVRNNRRQDANENNYSEEPTRAKNRGNCCVRDSNRSEIPAFERNVGGRYSFRGIVSSISPTSRFISRPVKFFNSIFRGQPYQIGNPVHETIIRIEEISHSRIPDHMRSLVYYGEIGELNVGDDISVTAIKKDGRLIIRDLIINDIDDSVHPHGVIPAEAFRAISIIIILIAIMLIASIISFFTTGAVWNLLAVLVNLVMSIIGKIIRICAPLLVVLFIYWIFFRRRR